VIQLPVKMKIFMFLCLTAVLALAVLIRQSEQAPPEKSCKMVAADFTKRQIRGISHCTKTMKFKNGKDKSKKMNCILRCVLIKEKLLNEEGLTNMEIYNKFVEDEFPPSIMDRFNATFFTCMPIAFAGFKTLEEDEYCTTIDPFIKCMMGQVPGLCNWS